MGKYIAPVLEGIVIGISAYFTGGGTLTAFSSSAFTSALWAGGIAAATGELAVALAPKAPTQNPLSQQVTIQSSVAPRILIYGQTRVSGVQVFFGCSGTSNKYLWQVIALAGHQCKAVTDVWLDNDIIPADTIDAGTGRVTSGKYKDKVFIWKKLGRSDQTALDDLVNAFPLWTATHRGQGICYMVVRMEFDPTVFTNGAPTNYFALVTGRIYYDQRLDSTNGGSGPQRAADPSTWGQGVDPSLILANPALAKQDYLTGGCMVNDLTSIPDNLRLGMKESTSRINYAQFAAAANECDEKLQLQSIVQSRYECNGVLSCVDTHSTNMSRLNSSDAGAIAYSGGTYRGFSASYDVPAHSITDRDLGGKYTVQTATATKDLANAISGIYIAADRNYQQVTSMTRTDSTYETADGRQILKQIDLPMTTDEFHAQRLCEIAKRRTRNQTTATLTFGLNGYKGALWENFNLNLVELASPAVFKITGFEISFGPDALITWTGVVENSSVYTDVDGATGYVAGAPVQITDPIILVLYPPLNLQITPLAGGVLIDWDAPQISYKSQAYDVWGSRNADMSAGQLLKTTTDTQYWFPVSDASVWYFQVRSNYGGLLSQFVPSTGGLGASAQSVSTGLSVSANPGVVDWSDQTSTSTTPGAALALAFGGTAPYTYAWSRISGSSIFTAGSPTASTTLFTANGATVVGNTYSAIFQCLVTDAAAATKTVQFAVSYTRTLPGESR